MIEKEPLSLTSTVKEDFKKKRKKEKGCHLDTGSRNGECDSAKLEGIAKAMIHETAKDFPSTNTGSSSLKNIQELDQEGPFCF